MLRAAHRPLAGSMVWLCSPLSACLAGGRSSSAAAPSPPSGARRGLHGGGRNNNGRIITPESESAWRKPEAGRLKLNFDGSSKHASRRASIGGVYRDHEGGFMLGYAERIGRATSSVAELAVANGWRSVWVEGDAKTAVDVVRSRARVRAEEDSRLCAEIAALLPLLDDLSVSHVRRQGNRVAHGFAKLGHGAATPRVWRDAPPDEVLRYLQRDAEGEGKEENSRAVPELLLLCHLGFQTLKMQIQVSELVLLCHLDPQTLKMQIQVLELVLLCYLDPKFPKPR